MTRRIVIQGRETRQPVLCSTLSFALPAALLALALLCSAAVAPAAVKSPSHAAILLYHHFGSDTPPATTVSIELFAQHLQYLAEHDFTVLTLQNIISHLQEDETLPPRCVAITVDDAFLSVYAEAYPRLQARGWPLTVFVSTEGVDRGYRGYLSWDQMREMAAHGVSFAPHSHTHGHLVWREQDETEGQWEARVRKDILTSQRRLQEELGAVPALFAYPYGEYSVRLREIVLDLDLVGFGQQSGPVWSGSDFGVLPRFPMANGFAKMSEFRVKVNSLPLPVLRVEPVEPLLTTDEKQPILKLWLAPGDYQIELLACYASGLGRIPMRWIDRGNGILAIRADMSLPLGRSRYNITAPDLSGRRFYWYSHLWIRGRTED